MTAPQISPLRMHESQAIPVAGVYTIDPSHTTVEFVVGYLMITKVRGRFADARGSIIIAEDPEQSSVEAQVYVGSINTGSAERDAHLLSSDFFDVDRFPSITFRSTSTRALEEGAWEVTGDLTLRDVTQAIALRVEFDGGNVSPFGDEERIGFSATGVVNREDFGLTWNKALETGGVLVDPTVRIELNVHAIAAPSADVA